MTKKMKPILTPISGVPADSGTTGSARRASRSETPPERAKTTFSATADGFMAAAQSSASKRAYASDIRHFQANGGTIPASPAQIVEYLANFAEKLSVATLERRLIAIHRQHQTISAISPTHDPVVKRTMQGIRRTVGTRQRQVRPIVKDDLLETLVLIDRQKPVKAARDRALLLIGFSGAFRRSELVAIRLEHISHVDNGIEVFLPQSKTDQIREGRTVYIPHANGLRCPVRALAQWLEISEITEGFVFRAVTRHDRIARHGLSAQSVALLVKSSVERAGSNPALVSGHSLRAGYCTTAAMQGLPAWQIKITTGHKSDATLSKYIRPVTRRKTPSLL